MQSCYDEKHLNKLNFHDHYLCKRGFELFVMLLVYKQLN